MKKLLWSGMMMASLWNPGAWGLTPRELTEFDKRIDLLIQQKKITPQQGQAMKVEVRHIPQESAQHALNGLREVTR